MTNPNDAQDDETVARLGDLARQALRSQTSLLKQSVVLTRATLSGELDRATASKAYVEAVSREGAKYWRAFGALGIDYASDLVALGSRVTETILADTARAGGHTHQRAGGFGSGHDGTAGTRGPTATPSSDATGAATGRHVTVTLRGPLGGRAEASVSVANKHPRGRRVQLSAGDLTDAGGSPVGAALEVVPTRVTVPAGQERAVTVGVELSPEQFTAGGHYTGTVEVSGGDEATLDVLVEVED